MHLFAYQKHKKKTVALRQQSFFFNFKLQTTKKAVCFLY